jgi:predicted outer membrane lipoprotein
MDIKELYWAAGFLEGEGTFSWRKKPNNQFAIYANQVDPESLYRLKQHWGGSIYGPLKRTNPRHQPFFAWYLGGPNAAAFAMMIYSLMTGRRQEKIKFALAEWRKVPFDGRRREHCKYGHSLADARIINGSRHCRSCALLRNRKHRASKKAARSEVQQPTVH